MIGKRMFSMFDKELGPLQQEQIRLGRENGLSDAQVALYATSMYNFAQMREIRLALEHNADPRQLRSMLKSWLPAQQMEALRKRLERGEVVRSRSSYATAVCLAALSCSAFSLAASGYFKSSERPYLTLTSNNALVNVGESFEPLDYVDSYPMEKGYLILPKEIDTSVPGTVAAVYRYHCDGQEIMRTLRVIVTE